MLRNRNALTCLLVKLKLSDFEKINKKNRNKNTLNISLPIFSPIFFLYNYNKLYQKINT